MDIKEYKNIFEQEESHFFYLSLHRLILQLINKYFSGRDLKILDAGCGTGGLMKLMQKYGSVRGVDFSSEAVRFAKKRKLEATLGSVTKLPFEAKTFDLVTCIDVLYHRGVIDDAKALVELKRVLKKNGVLIIRVQADKALKTAHDRFVHSRRRYTLGELQRKIKAAGLKIELISYVHSPLWPVAKLMLWMEKLRGVRSAKSGVGQVNPVVNEVLIGFLGLEANLILWGIRPPIGLGVLAVASKL